MPVCMCVCVGGCVLMGACKPAGIETWALHMLGKHCTPELQSQKTVKDTDDLGSVKVLRKTVWKIF